MSDVINKINDLVARYIGARWWRGYRCVSGTPAAPRCGPRLQAVDLRKGLASARALGRLGRLGRVYKGRAGFSAPPAGHEAPSSQFSVRIDNQARSVAGLIIKIKSSECWRLAAEYNKFCFVAQARKKIWESLYAPR